MIGRKKKNNVAQLLQSKSPKEVCVIWLVVPLSNGLCYIFMFPTGI